MKRWVMGLVALSGVLMVGAGLQAHHAVRVYMTHIGTMVLEGRLKKLNFTNPHASIEITVPNKDGTFTDWVLTTASIQILTRAGRQQELHQTWRAPQGHDPSGEEREPGGIHQEAPAG